jgi:hypothetical protein
MDSAGFAVNFSKIVAALTLCFVAAASSEASLRFEWRDSFTPREKDKLTMWVRETADALESLVGPLPFEVLIVFHRSDGSREPVPWANTQRSRNQGVHFHVDPRYPLEAFRRDWTAPHELSHLVLPYVGSKNRWFAEGFASYMQYQVMHAMGVLDEAQLLQQYWRKLDWAARRYVYSDQPFAEAAPRLRADGQYPVMYWGGAVYFLQADDGLLEQAAGTLLGTLSAYLECCRRNRRRLSSLAAELDAVSGTTVFSASMTRFEAEAGFPEYADLGVLAR